MTAENKEYKLAFRFFKELFKELHVFHHSTTAPVLLAMLEQIIDQKIMTWETFLQLSSGIIPHAVLQNADAYFSTLDESFITPDSRTAFQEQLYELLMGLKLYFRAVGKKDPTYYANYLSALLAITREDSGLLN